MFRLPPCRDRRIRQLLLARRRPFSLGLLVPFVLRGMAALVLALSVRGAPAASVGLRPESVYDTDVSHMLEPMMQPPPQPLVQEVPLGNTDANGTAGAFSGATPGVATSFTARGCSKQTKPPGRHTAGSQRIHGCGASAMDCDWHEASRCRSPSVGHGCSTLADCRHEQTDRRHRTARGEATWRDPALG